MKVTKKLKKALCAGLAGCLILGCLAGCGGTKEKVFSGPKDKNCTSYVIPKGVTKIGERAFSGCKSLTSIEMPNSVTVIGANAFNGCKSLTSIEIPNSVRSIGFDAFSGCSSLKTIKVPQGMDVSNWGLDEGVQVIYY